MPAIDVPDNVARAVLARWPTRAAVWLDNAPAEIAALCARHSVVPVRVLAARFALVVVASSADRSLVLRSTADPHGQEQALAARALAELGVSPRVHEVVTTNAGTCVVMDEVRLGTSVDTCTSYEMAELLRPLVTAPVSADELPAVSAWIRTRLEGQMDSDMYPGASSPSKAERVEALALLDVLEGDEAWSVCHGDVSLGNVIRGQEQLYLIDARGVTGDVEYDAAVAAIKAGFNVRDLAQKLRVDAERAEAWATIAAAARV